MLTIHIVDGNPENGILEFDVNGNRGNGNGDAKRTWQVHWIVKPGSAVLGITNISMKSVPGNTDIFTNDPPAQQGNGRQWKAKVDDNAPIADYYYDIEWESESGVKTHDPKISVKP
ncbi:hypothetical protein [Daejeonella oryzae]|uniref:hypothetical protein n=1 Tax=Daejeonella oryzae TaxID=1122943 RepID=UPI0003F5390B|nr:hypothetical protein [Daejeonella oryzae]